MICVLTSEFTVAGRYRAAVGLAGGGRSTCRTAGGHPGPAGGGTGTSTSTVQARADGHRCRCREARSNQPWDPAGHRSRRGQQLLCS